MRPRRSLAAVLAALVPLLAPTAVADTSAVVVTDDPALDQALADARAAFLARRPYVSRLDAVLLTPDPAQPGAWLRGSHGPDAIAYPASVVKLAYLVGAVDWAAQNGLPYDHLDASVRPMIVGSSNWATGEVVDAITGAPNYPTSTPDATFQAWLDARRFTEKLLASHGLLENQVVLHKTYPTNSGSTPSGAEALAISQVGGNRMQAKATASLLLELVEGHFVGGAEGYMRELLTSDPWGGDSVLGFGLPPGVVYENKLGLAYDTLEDVAHVILPDGRRFVLSVFSDAFTGPEPSNPYPYDASGLGLFTELLLERLGWDASLPAKVVVDDGHPGLSASGAWTTVTDQVTDYDMHGTSYLAIASNATGAASATWDLALPEGGTWEVCVWSPQKSTGTMVRYEVQHAGGSELVVVDQRENGGRWVRLGDWPFAAGAGRVVLTSQGLASGKWLAADAVKATRWPSLVGDLACASLTDGGTQALELRLGPAHAGATYLLLGSLSGTTPGLQLAGVQLPLNPDVYSDFVLGALGSGLYPGALGLLDAEGRATAAVVLPAGLLGPGFVGLQAHHAALVLDAAGPVAVTPAVGLELVP